MSPQTDIGHGNGTGNGSFNNNSVELTLFSYRRQEKPPPQEEKEEDGGAAQAILIGGAVVLGAVATWAVGKFISRGQERKRVEDSSDKADPTTMEGVQKYLT